MPGFYKDVYHEYMIIDKISTEDDYHFEEQMLHNHEIKGLLKFKIEFINEKSQYYYDIYRMDSIEMQHKENQIHYRNLTDMFRQLKELLEILKDYLLSPDNLWLDSMGIYMDRNSREYMFTYIPGLERDFRKQFESFVSWIMKVIDHNEKDSVILIYSMYKRISQEDDIVSILENVKENDGDIFNTKIISETSEQAEENTPSFIVKEESEVCDNKENQASFIRKEYIYFGCAVILAATGICLKDFISYALRFTTGLEIHTLTVCVIFFAAALLMTILGIRDRLISGTEKESRGKDFWDNVQRPDYQALLHDETTLLDSRHIVGKKRQLLILKRQGADDFENDIIYVTKVPFIVGKQHDAVQYVLNENTISRRHFKIDLADGAYTIEDMASTNGTWLNGKRLKADVLYTLCHNDTIKAAGIIFLAQIKEDV